MSEDVLLGSLPFGDEDVTYWAEDDNPESLQGEDADDELGGEDA